MVFGENNALHHVMHYNLNRMHKKAQQEIYSQRTNIPVFAFTEMCVLSALQKKFIAFTSTSLIESCHVQSIGSHNSPGTSIGMPLPGKGKVCTKCHTAQDHSCIVSLSAILSAMHSLSGPIYCERTNHNLFQWQTISQCKYWPSPLSQMLLASKCK